VRITGFGAVTAAMLPAYLAKKELTDARLWPPQRDLWVGAWASALLRIFGLRVLVFGARPGGACGHLVVANHRSTADILILLRSFGGKMVSRSDLAAWPLVGLAARAVGTVFVDREDAVSGANAVRGMRSSLTGGDTIIVFPEGTTFAGDAVRPFRSGAFVAALRSGADIVPVGIAYGRESGAAFVNESFPAHLARVAAADASTVVMCIGDPIAIQPGDSGARLRDRAHTTVQTLVADARKRVDG
jgi:1-acyl-sn-glycerol-3-phosphate acyltransferase